MELFKLVSTFVLFALATYVITVGWFLALAKASELKAAGVVFDNWLVRYPAYVFLAVGAVFDVLFNAVWGTIIFRELPQEFFFTARVKRHVKDGNEKALEWKDRINKISANHI